MPLDPEPSTGLFIAAALALLAGTLPAFAGGRLRLPAWLTWLPATAASILALVGSLEVIGSGRPASLELPQLLGASRLSFVLTPFSAWLALAVAGPGLAAALAAAAGLGRTRGGPVAVAGFHLLLLGQLLFLAAGDGVALLLSWQLVAIGGWASLIAANVPGEGESSRAPWRYFLACQAAAVLMAAGMLLLIRSNASGVLGGLNFAEMKATASGLGPATRSLAFLLLLVGIGPAAGLAPLHSSMPRAGASAAAPAAALISAGLPSLGLSLLARVLLDWLAPAPAWWGALLLLLTALTMLHTLLLAIASLDLRRLVAEAGTGGSGLALLALGVAALAASHAASGLGAFALEILLFVALAHATVQVTLVLATGALYESAGTSRLDAMGGLLRRMPWSAAPLLIGFFAAAALPPLGGFVSLWLVTQVLLVALHLPLGAFKLAVLGAITGTALTGSLALVTALRAIAIGTLGPAAPPGSARERLALRHIPALAAATMCLGLGLFAGSMLLQIAPTAAAQTSWTGLVPALAVPAPQPVEAWPGSATGLPELGLLRMPALVAALAAATLVGLALLRPGRAVRASAEPVRGTKPGAPEAAARTGAPRPMPGLTASGYAQPLVAALPELYGAVEEATILEGSSAHFPTRVAFHHGIEPWLAARSARIGAVMSEATTAMARQLSGASLRGRMAWLLAAAVALLLVLGR